MTRHTSFVPLIEVTSSFLNGQQDATLLQRAGGPANTMARGLDNPSRQHAAKVIGFSSTGKWSPPITGLLDAEMDWRDRHIEVQIAFDPKRDIRWGRADDDKTPEYEWAGHWYSLLGGKALLLDPLLSLGIYVSLISGNLMLLCSREGFVRGQIRASVQLKERLP